MDHGIEKTHDRQTSGKPQVATVKIEGVQTAANVTIRISDDGGGLNEEKILKIAREKGLVPSNSKPSPSEIHQMIFLPGFSTADKVTDVSGRGVGMDVVKRAVDELGGEITIHSRLGQGTEFNISLPSTLSILDAIIVGLADQLYAIPVQDVLEVIDMSSAHIETTTQRGRMLNVRGKALPVERLNEYLPGNKTTEKNAGVALVTRLQSSIVAFEVDRIAGQQSIVVRQLDGNLSKVPGYSGGTILSNGEPSMIVHLPQIVKSYLMSIK